MSGGVSGGALYRELLTGRFVLDDGRQGWDSARVHGAVSGLAGHVGAGGVLAVLADNSPAWVAADLASLAVGKAHLPLPAFFSPEQLRHALDSAGADMLLSDQPERLEALGLGFSRVADWEGLVLLGRRIEPNALPRGTTKISFTSGSTGAPKGVCLRADGLLATARSLVTALDGLTLERHLSVLPLALLLENVAGVYAPMLRGMSVHLPSLETLGWRGMAGFDPARLHAAAAASGAQSLILVPELLKAWRLFLAATRQRAPEDLRFVAVGGAACAPELILGARALGLPAYEGYGLTECGSVTCLNRPGADRPGGVGQPLPHVDLKLDGAGEIHVATPAFAGYMGCTEEVGEHFATGDLGRIEADGSLTLAGRRKNLLVTGFGRNVAPEWPESLFAAQDGVAQALVLGDGRPWLTALLVAMPGREAGDLAAAVDRVNAQLPDYARIGAWLPVPPFTFQDGLATGNGRPIRSAIADRHAPALEDLYREKESIHVLL